MSDVHDSVLATLLPPLPEQEPTGIFAKGLEEVLPGAVISGSYTTTYTISASSAPGTITWTATCNLGTLWSYCL